jgi:hypothetical protein
MNKFIDEGLKAGYEFIILEPQDGYNEAIVGFDYGRLVYDTETLMDSMRKYHEWEYETAITWFEYNTLSTTYMDGGPLFFEPEEEFYLTHNDKRVTLEVRNKIMEDK